MEDGGNNKETPVRTKDFSSNRLADYLFIYLLMHFSKVH